LFGGFFVYFLRHPGTFDFLFIVFHLNQDFIGFSQFPVNRPYLLTQEVVSLAPGHLFFNFGLYFRLHGRQLDLPGKKVVHLLQTQFWILDLKQLLAILDIQP